MTVREVSLALLRRRGKMTTYLFYNCSPTAIYNTHGSNVDRVVVELTMTDYDETPSHSMIIALQSTVMTTYSGSKPGFVAS